MKLSVSISAPGSKFAPIMLQGDYAEKIYEAKELGFSAVELHIRDPKAVDQGKILGALEKTKLAVSTIGTGQAWVDERLSFASADGEIRRRAIQRIKDHCDFAAQLGGIVIIGTIKGPLPGDSHGDLLAKTRAEDCLRECADYAGALGVQLTVEAINRYETNFLNRGLEVVEFIEGLNRPNVGLHLDTFHMNIEEIHLAQTIRDCRDHLIHFHLADSNRWPPGYGHIEFLPLLTALREIGYKNHLALESLPLPDPQQGARRGREHIEELLRSLAT
ncbi:MAG: TIM barrel protein [Limnochordia bacterium]|jgi:sugar phosphate isomerase/epimerase